MWSSARPFRYIWTGVVVLYLQHFLLALFYFGDVLFEVLKGNLTLN